LARSSASVSDPAWGKWLEGERGAVDRWMKKHHDRVEWVAGLGRTMESARRMVRTCAGTKDTGEETESFREPVGSAA